MSRGFLPLLGTVLLIGMSALVWGTEGFRAITTEGARQLSVARHPLPVPAVRLVDQDGHPFSLADYRGTIVLVDFIYTRCPKLCGVLGDDFHRMLALAPKQDIKFLSISFDPENDNRDALKLYGDRYDATPPRWRIAATADSSGLAALLRTFGVIVIPDGLGGFVHDDSIYLIDRKGRFARIFESGAPPQLIEEAMRPATP